MNENQEKKDKILCTCTGTTEIKIKQLIAQGVDNMEDISSATGANTGCGSCDVLIVDLLSEAKNKEVEAV